MTRNSIAGKKAAGRPVAGERAPRGVPLGHARVRVHRLERSVEFYGRVLGLHVTERVGRTFAFLSCNTAHHQIALQEVSRKTRSSALGHGTVDHLAFEVRSTRELGRVYRSLLAQGVQVQAADNGISWALYFADPDGMRLEVFLDRRSLPGGRKLWRGGVRLLSARELERLARPPNKR